MSAAGDHDCDQDRFLSRPPISKRASERASFSAARHAPYRATAMVTLLPKIGTRSLCQAISFPPPSLCYHFLTLEANTRQGPQTGYLLQPGAITRFTAA